MRLSYESDALSHEGLVVIISNLDRYITIDIGWTSTINTRTTNGDAFADIYGIKGATREVDDVTAFCCCNCLH